MGTLAERRRKATCRARLDQTSPLNNRLFGPARRKRTSAAHSHAIEMEDNAIRELGAGRARFRTVAGELPGDIVGDVELSSRTTVRDLFALRERRLDSLVNQTRRLVPTQVFQQHRSRE